MNVSDGRYTTAIRRLARDTSRQFKDDWQKEQMALAKPTINRLNEKIKNKTKPGWRPPGIDSAWQWLTLVTCILYGINWARHEEFMARLKPNDTPPEKLTIDDVQLFRVDTKELVTPGMFSDRFSAEETEPDAEDDEEEDEYEFSNVYHKGHTDGYSQGFTEGYQKGHAEGYQKGHAEGYQKGHAEGYQKGHAEGYQKGHAEGHATGSREGYQKALAEARMAQEARRAEPQNGKKPFQSARHTDFPTHCPLCGKFNDAGTLCGFRYGDDRRPYCITCGTLE